MRTALLTIAAAIGLAGAATTTASAQTYNPAYPVCLQKFGPVSFIDCRYDAIAQCQVSASGIGATCLVNPFFAGDRPRERRMRRS